ncbi:MAG: DUF4011 domain-containing protein [Sulfurospirillaceae bacterium]|nr:DUF4011 domain-containing protein [Sulfurospirillaceae bacterium]
MSRSINNVLNPDDKRVFKNGLEELKAKLIDTSRRNKLINYRNPQKSRNLRIIDESPDFIFQHLVKDEKKFKFKFIPEPVIDFNEIEKLKNEKRTLEIAIDNLKNSEHFEKYLYQIQEFQEQINKIDFTIKELYDQKLLTPEERAQELNLDISKELPRLNLQDELLEKKHLDDELQTLHYPSEMEKVLTSIERNARSIIEETGSNMLYLSLGFLHWNEAKNSQEYNKSPLVSIPITLTKSKSSNRYIFSIEYSQEGIDTNHSLAEKLSNDYGIIFPELNEEQNYDEYINQVNDVISNQPNWIIKHEIFLDFLHFGKILMYQDLKEENWLNDNALINNSILQDIFIGREMAFDSTFAADYEIDKHEDANTIPLVMDADSSQHSAIIDVLAGKNVIIEGPPGTGKSQTIANMIAGLISKGKSVLFVSEKLAALEVVHKRLNHVGLSDFCLELHSHKSQKSVILKSIEQRLEAFYPDIKTLETIINDINYTKTILQNYSDLIYREFGSFKKTIYDILWIIEKNSHISKHLSFTIEGIDEHSNETFELMLKKLEAYSQITSNYNFEECYWKGFKTHDLKFIDIDDFMQNLSLMCQTLSEVDRNLRFLPVELEDEYSHIYSINSFMQNIPETNDFHSLIKVVCQNKNSFHDYLQLYTKLENTTHHLLEDIRNLYTYSQFNASFKKSLLRAAHNIKTLNKETNIPANGDIDYLKVLLQAIASLNSVDKSIYIYLTIEYGGMHFENLLTQAIQEFQAIKAQKEELALFCKIEAIELKTIDQIMDLEKILQEKKDSFFNFLSKDFKNAKSVLSSLLKIDLPSNKTLWIEYLQKIKHYQSKQERYNNNTLYKTSFKQLFQGENTHWKDIETLHHWASRIRKEIKNSDLQTVLLHGDEYIYDTLIQVHESLKETIYEIENNIEQSYSIYGQRNTKKLYVSKDNINIFELLKNIEAFDENIEQTIKEFNKNCDPNEKLLNNFTMNDINQIDIEEFYTHASLFFLGFNDLMLNAQNIIECTTQLNAIINRLNKVSEYPLGITMESNYAIEKVLELHGYIIKSSLPQELKDCLFDDYKKSLSALIEIHKSIKKFIEYKNKNECYGTMDISFLGDKPLSISQCVVKLQEAHNHKNMLSIWSEFQNITKSLIDLGLAPIVYKFEHNELPHTLLIPALHYNFFHTLTKAIFRKYPEMNTFSRLSHEQVIQKFKVLDLQLIEKNREQVAFLATKNDVPHGYRGGTIKELSQLNLILHEIKKKKKHIPIRQLVKRAGAALKGLKPCFMMSPLSVSQYLPPNEVNFDVLVIDEASQLKPEEAIGTIARVKQIVIVGDPKQLPPTSFFDSLDKSSDDNESVISESESILDFCLNLYQPVRQLKWHYRSQHETLIDFSNKQFYDSNLIVFPSPTKASNDELGVKYHYIKEAQYQDRKNKLEAKYIVEFLEKQMRQYPDRSIGVGTFNTEQRDLIQSIMDEREKSSTIISNFITKWDKTNEPFFIKNLENLQGDERDVICISTTFGKDKETHKVYQRFGPINSDVGWRRLNVLFTRAKQKMEVFTSMLSSDIIISSSSSRGVIALKAFLTYIETGTMSGTLTNTQRDFDSEFEISVNNLLFNCGYTVVPQVGVAGYFIDLAVVSKSNPNEYILGIECDGATYHSSKSARDRDRLKQEVLEKLGWKIYRIWSVDWFKNRDNEIKKLIEAVQNENQKKTSSLFNIIHEHTISSNPEKNNENIIVNKVENLQPQVAKEHIFSSDNTVKNELIKLRDTLIVKDFKIDKTCVLSPLMIDLFLKHKPLDMDDFRREIPLKIRQSLDSEQLVFMNAIFDILEKADE